MEQLVMFEFDYSPDEMPVEKEAKIFEAGEYPDKGIEISEDDLDAIVSNFGEVPVKVEHTDSPLDPLGLVKRVWRTGKDLFAQLAFPGDMASFLDRRGVKKLSVGLLKDPLRLAEVSIVLSPRIPSAAMFSEEGKNLHSEGHIVVNNLQFEEVNEIVNHIEERDQEIARLRFALREKDVDAKLSGLKSAGKISPAAETFAKEILLQGDKAITFGSDETTVGRSVRGIPECTTGGGILRRDCMGDTCTKHAAFVGR